MKVKKVVFNVNMKFRVKSGGERTELRSGTLFEPRNGLEFDLHDKGLIVGEFGKDGNRTRQLIPWGQIKTIELDDGPEEPKNASGGSARAGAKKATDV
jgi:hypothetical protein